MSAARYALYFAPSTESDWWRFGLRWLGYDPAACTPVEQTPPLGSSAAEFRAFTQEPRRYGFHATLKPPMKLAATASRWRLVEALESFCAQRAPFALPPMTVCRLGDFVACTPGSVDQRSHALARDCVREFDEFRAPSSPEDIAQRRAKGLTARQESYLLRWGYPYVLDEYRFHMTLTGPLSAACADAIVAAAQPLVAALGPLVCDAVCLFEQTPPATSFRIAVRVPLGKR
jgi:putative phosphonate metabolism protein